MRFLYAMLLAAISRTIFCPNVWGGSLGSCSPASSHTWPPVLSTLHHRPGPELSSVQVSHISQFCQVSPFLEIGPCPGIPPLAGPLAFLLPVSLLPFVQTAGTPESRCPLAAVWVSWCRQRRGHPSGLEKCVLIKSPFQETGLWVGGGEGGECALAPALHVADNTAFIMGVSAWSWRLLSPPSPPPTLSAVS